MKSHEQERGSEPPAEGNADPAMQHITRRIRADMDALATVSRASLRSPQAVIDGANGESTRVGDAKGANIMTASKASTRWLRISVAAAVLAFTGVVFAATQTSLFSIWVDTGGKTDEQVEGEIIDQLVKEGIDEPAVRYDSQGAHDRLEIEGAKGERRFELVREKLGEGDAATVIELEPPQLDVEREPGMTDEELEAKIRAQLEALGIDGEVEVQVQGEPCGDEPCDGDGQTEVQVHIAKCEDGPCDHAEHGGAPLIEE